MHAVDSNSLMRWSRSTTAEFCNVKLQKKVRTFFFFNLFNTAFAKPSNFPLSPLFKKKKKKTNNEKQNKPKKPNQQTTEELFW